MNDVTMPLTGSFLFFSVEVSELCPKDDQLLNRHTLRAENRMRVNGRHSVGKKNSIYQ
jgi:hypothetical protein